MLLLLHVFPFYLINHETKKQMATVLQHSDMQDRVVERLFRLIHIADIIAVTLTEALAAVLANCFDDGTWRYEGSSQRSSRSFNGGNGSRKKMAVLGLE